MSSYRHEALFYAGDDGFLAGTLPLVREAVADGRPTLVAISAAKARAMTAALGADAAGVQFANMADIGRNPARIIPVWQDFLDDHATPERPAFGIGEPIWPGRTDCELDECHRHEALLNACFDGDPAFRLVCPYDTEGLEPHVVAAARRTHPHVISNGRRRASFAYAEQVPRRFDAQLTQAPGDAAELSFGGFGLASVRAFVRGLARNAGLRDTRAEDLVLAINELATNSIRHATGHGTIRCWTEDDALLCEVSDRGMLDDPLVGRRRPTVHQIGGRGLWMVNHLCDLVHVRSTAAGTTVRVRMELRVEAAEAA